MICWGLTDLGHIVKLTVKDEDIESDSDKKVIEHAIVLDPDAATFTLDYNSKFGDLVFETITDSPKDVFDRISKTRVELEKRELAFMRNLFLIDNHSLKTLKKSRKRKKKEGSKNGEEI